MRLGIMIEVRHDAAEEQTDHGSCQTITANRLVQTPIAHNPGCRGEHIETGRCTAGVVCQECRLSSERLQPVVAGLQQLLPWVTCRQQYALCAEVVSATENASTGKFKVRGSGKTWNAYMIQARILR